VRFALAGFVLVLMVAACGPVGSSGPTGPTASSVALKSSDLPPGMVRCDLSGDINSYLNKIKTKDPTTYKTTSDGWAAAQKDGATAADVEFYTDSAAHCAAVESNSSQVGTATYKLAVNFVIQFKDQASAEKGYKSESIFGFSAASLKASQVPVVEGTATGLGANSIVLSLAIASQSFYVAVWQNKAFMSILAILNIDPATAKKTALAVNGRIH
jgi:hypothetical protein